MVRRWLFAACLAMVGVGSGPARAAEQEDLSLVPWRPGIDRRMFDYNGAYVYDASLPPRQQQRFRRGFVAVGSDGPLSHDAFARAIGDDQRATEVVDLHRRYRTWTRTSLTCSAVSMALTLTGAAYEDQTTALPQYGAALGLALSGLVTSIPPLVHAGKIKQRRYTLDEARAAIESASVPIAEAPTE